MNTARISKPGILDYKFGIIIRLPVVIDRVFLPPPPSYMLIPKSSVTVSGEETFGSNSVPR